MQHVDAGTKIGIYTDVFGARMVEFRTGWLRRRIKLELEPVEIGHLKEALRARREGRTPATNVAFAPGHQQLMPRLLTIRALVAASRKRRASLNLSTSNGPPLDGCTEIPHVC